MKRGKDIPDNLPHGWDQELQESHIAAVLCAGPQQTPHPTGNPKNPAHCNHSLLTGILGNSADFGSRGHGNVWVLLVEIKILRKKISTEESQLLESSLKTAIWKYVQVLLMELFWSCLQDLHGVLSSCSSSTEAENWHGSIKLSGCNLTCWGLAQGKSSLVHL